MHVPSLWRLILAPCSLCNRFPVINLLWLQQPRETDAAWGFQDGPWGNNDGGRGYLDDDQNAYTAAWTP